MKRDESILQKLVSRFSRRWQKQTRLAVKRLYELLENGMTVTAAVSRLSKEYSDLFKLDGLEDMLLEAACYGYGIMPSVLTADQRKEWGKQLAGKWDASGMKLSEKIHGASVKMRSAIIDTLQAQMFHSKTWTDTARALYDGYSKGENAFTGVKDIISRQELPQYIQKVLLATGDSETAVAQQLALENINKLAKGGAPNKALQSAYNELLEAVQEGNEKAIGKAVETAINEKSRYVAERIARTEMARAYADGFIAKIKDDPDIVAVKFKLGSRHPAFDICDMYARADMFNLGKGVYPKDKLPPLPIHPHCLCRYSEVIDGEVDTGKAVDNVQNAGDKWLGGLTEYQRRAVLGVEGAQAWQEGADWRKYMRGYAGLKQIKSRLAEVQLYKSVILGKDIFAEKYMSKAGVGNDIQIRKVENSSYNMYVSDNVKLKPKMLHEMERQLNDSFKLLQADEQLKKPQIIIVSNNDMSGALGGYIAKGNKLYINSDILTTKYKKALNESVGSVSKNPMATTLHELVHWKDAREYAKKYGEVTDQKQYMEYITAKHKKGVDELINTGYNIGEISSYAKKMIYKGRYDEVLTEYRVKIFLKGE